MSIRHSSSSCVDEHSATTVGERQHSFNPILVVRAAGQSQTKPDESRESRPTFIEDFLLEHSPRGQQADSMNFAGCF